MSSIWNPTLVVTSLNLRIETGRKAKDYKKPGHVAESQLQFNPDFICDYEDMEGCGSDEYGKMLESDFIRFAATDDGQGRGVSCWVKHGYSAEKIFSLGHPHFMHVMITNGDGIELNLLILRICVKACDESDFKDRRKQWEKILTYVDSLTEKKNIVLVGDFNHSVIAADVKFYKGMDRQYYNYQMIEQDLLDRNIQMVPMEGYSYEAYNREMKIDHLAVSSSVSAENARYEDVYGNVYGKNVKEIGIPDHCFIVSDLRICG